MSVFLLAHGAGIPVGGIDRGPQVRPVQRGEMIVVLVFLADPDQVVRAVVFESLGWDLTLEEPAAFLEILDHFPTHRPEMEEQEPEQTSEPLSELHLLAEDRAVRCRASGRCCLVQCCFLSR